MAYESLYYSAEQVRKGTSVIYIINDSNYKSEACKLRKIIPDELQGKKNILISNTTEMFDICKEVLITSNYNSKTLLVVDNLNNLNNFFKNWPTSRIFTK